jgi:hypothetical protein
MARIEMDESFVSVTSLVAAKLPKEDDRIGALAARIAGMLKPPVDPNEQLTADQTAKAARWVTGHVDGVEALRAGGVLTENVLIPKEEYLALVAARDIVIRIFGRMNQAFSEDAEILNTVDNERERLALALWGLARFFGEGGLNLPTAANQFFELGSAISDLNAGIRHPLLLPKKKRKGASSPLTSRYWRARVHVVLAFKALCRMESEPVNKATMKKVGGVIAKKFPDLAELVRTNTDDETKTKRPVNLPLKITEWLEIFDGKSAAADEAKVLYDICCKGLEESSSDDLSLFAAQHLNVALTFCKSVVMK